MPVGGADGGEQPPLQGVILCSTALSQDVRTRLAGHATQMGAEHKLDLTTDVTHLIVGNIATPKYRYVAKERPDIVVLHQDWIEAVRQQWMLGGDVDVKGLEEQHRLPAFFDLKICVTGFDDPIRRNFISDTVQKLGAEYHPDLTKRVTHLIAAAPQGAKYTHAKQWGISIVSERWFEESRMRGMALDESLYDPAMPLDEQGRGAYRTEPKLRTSLGKRPRESEAQMKSEAGQRKLRRTASTRLSSHSQDVWEGYSARSATLEPSEVDQWRDDSEGHEHGVQPRRPKIQVRQSDVFRPTAGEEPEVAPEGLFSGMYMLIRGFRRDRAGLLQTVLESNGACVVPSVEMLEKASENPYFQSRCLLVPHDRPDGSFDLPDVPEDTQQVTEWWVERCVHYKRFFDPAEDVLSRPLWDSRVAGLEGRNIATTGFSGVDFRQTTEVVRLMGANYQENLTPSVAVLISGMKTVRKEKAFYANKHSIPVVSAGWLWECLELKQVVPYDGHKIKLPAFDPNELVREPSASTPACSDVLQRRASTGSDKT
jgi:DNA replication regulator DPB11